MRFHWLRLRATAHATEDPERVRRAMAFVSGLDAEAFDAATEATPVEAHHGGDVVFFETLLKRAGEVRPCIARLLEASKDLASEVEARTDDDGVFYLRFDKQAAFLGRLTPTHGDDAVQVRIKPEVHPAHRDNAIAALDELVATGRP